MIWYNGVSKAKIKGDLKSAADKKDMTFAINCYFLQCENVSITAH
jgi:hypothetical protein